MNADAQHAFLDRVFEELKRMPELQSLATGDFVHRLLVVTLISGGTTETTLRALRALAGRVSPPQGVKALELTALRFAARGAQLPARPSGAT